MAISFSGSDEELSHVFVKGLMDGVRSRVKQQLMTECEKIVNAALDQIVADLKVYAESRFDHTSGKQVIHISINGVKKEIT